MRRTKIVCTMGPNTNSRDLMKKLIETGMDVARFNFSHGDHDEQKMRMDMLKELRKELKTPVGDPSGHQRTGNSYRRFKRWKKSESGNRTDFYPDNRSGDRR